MAVTHIQPTRSISTYRRERRALDGGVVVQGPNVCVREQGKAEGCQILFTLFTLSSTREFASYPTFGGFALGPSTSMRRKKKLRSKT